MADLHQLEARFPAPQGARTADPEPAVTLSLVRLLNVPLRHRRTILRWSLAVGLALTAAVLIRPREFRSSTSFFPQGSHLSGALSGVAAQFGLGMAAQGEASRSPQFYVDLLHSRGFLARLVEHPYEVTDGKGRRSATLIDVFADSSHSAAQRRDEAIRTLDGRIRVQVADKTGIVSVAVASRDADLSRQIADQLLAEITRFNLETRRTQAGAERQFAERRLADARAELRRDEDRLRAFLESNRELSFSPALQTERGRLADAINEQRQLVATLNQSYEQARLDEVRDTPVITVMDTPERAARPEPRRLAVWVAAGLIVGALIGILVAYTREYLQAVRRGDAEGFAQFEALSAAAVSDLRSPVGLLLGSGARKNGRERAG